MASHTLWIKTHSTYLHLIVVWVRLESSKFIPFSYCILWQYLRGLDWLFSVSLGDCHHLGSTKSWDCWAAIRDCCQLWSSILKGSYAHSPRQIVKRNSSGIVASRSVSLVWFLRRPNYEIYVWCQLSCKPPSSGLSYKNIGC